MFRGMFSRISASSMKLPAGIAALSGLALTSNQFYNQETQPIKQQLFAPLKNQSVLQKMPLAEASTDRIYSREEIQKEARQNKKVWVTYKDGVYDLTQFAKSHPGGSDKLHMAAGGPIEPWWQMYPFHKEANIISLLAEFKIGSLHPDEVLDEKDLPDFSDLQTQHLERSPLLRVLSKFPFNAQTPSKFLGDWDFYYTPKKMFFERNHNLIPEIDVEDYEIQLMPNGRIDEDQVEKTLTFDDIKKMPQMTLVAYVACAGNKRKFLQDEFPNVKGLKWTQGGISSAKFRGVSVKHILLNEMGHTEESLKGKNLIAFGVDADFQGKHYEVSVPCEHILDESNEVMLAYEMNDEPLTPEHGYPIRMFTPGCIAVRSCKWVGKLIVSDEEADSTPQRRDYKIVKDKDVSTVQWDKHKPVYWHPINSGIGLPEHGDEISGTVTVQGWAHGTQGTQATQVQLSLDGGKTWNNVDEYMMEDKPSNAKVWSWTLWRKQLDTSKLPKGPLEMQVRAIDDKGAIQDGEIKDLYNIRGIMNNAPHSINVTVA